MMLTALAIAIILPINSKQAQGVREKKVKIKFGKYFLHARGRTSAGKTDGLLAMRAGRAPKEPQTGPASDKYGRRADQGSECVGAHEVYEEE